MGPHYGTYLESWGVHHVAISDNRKLKLGWASNSEHTQERMGSHTYEYTHRHNGDTITHFFSLVQIQKYDVYVTREMLRAHGGVAGNSSLPGC
jgi:hypothetical protein